MAVAPDTAADLVNRIFDLPRVVRCVAAASFRGQDTGVALQGVLRFVGERESRATHLAERLGVSAPVLSRHIADLRRYGTDLDETLGIPKHSAREHSVLAVPAQTLQEH